VARGALNAAALAAAGKEVIVVTLSSTAFADGAPIPRRHTCEGEDLSPALAWDGLPEGTASLALLVDDPDAPGGTFTHWIAWGIDPSASGVAEGAAPPCQGRNGFGSHGYRGPCPPTGAGPHRYVFQLYALDAPIGLDPDADKRAFQAALAGHVLGAGELIGTYERR
jgi:Raf kinase inhibitor-like YbhB/YbcL family protein